MSENKRYTYLDYSKDKYIGSFFCNGVILKNNEVVDILKEQEERIKELEKENELLKQEIEEHKAVINREWNKYLKKHEMKR